MCDAANNKICKVEYRMAIPTFPPIGMSPSVWGPIFWNTMHIITLGYPERPSESEKAAAAAFFESLTKLIPCPICSSHYSEFLKEMPPQVDNRSGLIFWMFNLHNKVNARLGKSEISFEQFIDNMRKLSQMHSVQLPQKENDGMLMFALGAVVGIGAVYAYQKYK